MKMATDRLMQKRKVPFSLYDITLSKANNDELKELSKEMGLSLSLDEMKSIQEYFKKEKREPTDIELQALGQAWSEHCCYKSSKVILKEYVFGIEHPDVLSRGDAGVMVFDKDHGYALRIESHNHPSAIEPYGGAATGIGGILRDVVCMGAQPIGLVDPLCFGPIDTKSKIPAGMKHPRYLTAGVVAGIRDYGNRMGVPTVSGGFFFDERYTGNCLVNVGCLGIVKRDELLDNFVSGPGEYMILCGGRTGRDGIHGVTFASADLTSTSDEDSRGAVQLGDPITKEPLTHACLEVNKRKLITGMKDLGGGGLSCVIGEMALAAGCGADVNLEKVPLKEEGLAPWEIWVSESQERMMLSAKEENVKEILEIFELWDVLATVVAKSTKTPRTRLFWDGEPIFDMDLEYLTGGPMYCRPYTEAKRSSTKGEKVPKLPSHNDVLLTLLSDLNVASKEWAIRQYDHEVRASTIIRPMVGKMNKTGPGDATVLKPVPESMKGLAAAVGCNPWFTDEDPYRGGMASIEEACRNLVAVGARPHAITNCLNFGNPEKPERLGELREAVHGLGDICKFLGLPIPSGNVSLYNEAPGGKVILPTPMILATGLIDDVRKSVTADMKKEGSSLFVVGKTKNEMGGSLLYRKFDGSGGEVPAIDLPKLKENMDKLLSAMDKGLVASCHDCSDGGLSVALAEMCFSGDIGAEIDLKKIDGLDVMQKMYAESNSRWVVEITKENKEQFKKIMGDSATEVGVTGGTLLIIPEAHVSINVDDLREAWNDPIWKMMGGQK